MKTTLLLFVLCLSCAFADPLAEVDPLIGTTADGNVTPGPLVPFGMIQWSPDTPKHPTSNYEYNAKAIQGFSLTHMSGTGCPNSAELPILPTVGANETGSPVGFTHDDEQAAPGYYRVSLANAVRVELTTATRAALGRFHFPATADANLMLDAGRASFGDTDGEIQVKGRQITGWTRGGNFCWTDKRYLVYFAAVADRDFKVQDLSSKKKLLIFDARRDSSVQLKVAISYVDIDGAVRNLDEISDWDFEATRSRALDAWRAKFAAVKVDGGTQRQRRVFHTALYRSLLHPNVFSDLDGRYRGFDDKIRNTQGRVHYANFSGWDIYRSQVQLIALLFPRIGSDIAQSLVHDAEQCGALPKWSQNNVEVGVMVGDPGSAAIAGLDAFGAIDFDRPAALRFMRHSAFDADASCKGVPIRPGADSYFKQGWIPEPTPGVWGSVSTTLEYAIADFTIARFAQRLGDTTTASQLAPRAASWRHYLNGEWLAPRLADGSWVPGISPVSGTGYVEGNAAQYRWLVPHDPEGLIAAMGGKAATVAKLDAFFTKLNANVGEPHFYIGNEPGFSTPWLYLWADAPHRTADVVHRILDEAFSEGPAGMPGNDDMGATSSWVVWSALGLFPAVPGVGELSVSSPWFPRAEVTFSSGKNLILEAGNAPARYVKTITRDGAPLRSPWVSVESLKNGGRISFELVETPSY